MPPTIEQSVVARYGATFGYALSVVLLHEGRYVNDPDDPGGATNWGVSLRAVSKLDEDLDGILDFDLDGDGDVDADDIRAMPLEKAAEYYHGLWSRGRYAELGDMHVSAKAFDLAVNMGAGQLGRVLQRALRACGHPIVEDGIVGRKTRTAAALADPRRLMTAIRCEAAGFYRVLVALKPVRSKYEAGWLNRAYA
jgi:lysozyme family protein